VSASQNVPAAPSPEGAAGTRTPVAAADGARAVTGPRTWTLEFPPGMKMLSLNDRSHWRVRYARGEVIRKAAWALAKAARIPPLERIVVTAEYQPPDRRKRDEDNLTLAVKSAIDGIKAAKVVPDDSSDHVRYDGCRIGERYPKGRLLITIAEVPR
jgi:crossover junction endodeoxyribonuclease RusA